MNLLRSSSELERYSSVASSTLVRMRCGRVRLRMSMKRSSPASESRMFSTNGTFWNFHSMSMSWFWPISRSWKMIGAIQSMSETRMTSMLFFLGPAAGSRRDPSFVGILGGFGGVRFGSGLGWIDFRAVGGLLGVGARLWRRGRRRRRRCLGRGRR